VAGPDRRGVGKDRVMQLQTSPCKFPEFTVKVGSLASLAAGLFKCRAGLE
jgi:hypothetical protein